MSNPSFIAFEDYLRSEKRASEKTLVAYSAELSRWESFLNAEFEATPEDALRAHIKRFIIWRSKQGISNRSINRTLSSLRTYYKWCERTGRQHKNPVSGIRSLKEEKRLVMSIPQDDLLQITNKEAFDETFEGIRNQYLLLLLYGLGLRKSELIELQCKDLDLERSVVRITGKRNKTRQVPIPDALLPYHKAYMKARSEVEAKSDHLLLTLRGGKLYPSLVYNTVVHYLKGTTSVVDKHPHTLRHSYATHLLNAGVDINTVKELMGHESLSSTQIYTTSTFEELVKAYNQAHPKGS